MIVVVPLMSKRKLYTTGVYLILFDAGCNWLLKHLLFRQIIFVYLSFCSPVKMLVWDIVFAFAWKLWNPYFIFFMAFTSLLSGHLYFCYEGLRRISFLLLSFTSDNTNVVGMGTRIYDDMIIFLRVCF